LEDITKKLKKLVKTRKTEKVVYKIGTYKSSSGNPSANSYDGYDPTNYSE
jgi:hypothetical protein